MMDPISDMLNRIRNGQTALHPTVEVLFSNLKFEVAKIMEKNNFIEKIERKGKKDKKAMEITLKYENGSPVISGIKRISKSGQRIYKSYQEIRPVKGGYGIAIISTSKGILSDKEARAQKVGGEVICEVW